MTAKIKLNAASGGGSFSLQAPSSSSNARVMTLPDTADGTILTTTNPKAGNILQFVHGSQQVAASQGFSSNAFVDTGLSASITPASTSNKILVTGYLCYFFDMSSSGNGEWNFAITDGSNNILDGTTADGNGYRINNGATLIAARHPINFLHSPSTTSSFTYKIRMNAKVSEHSANLVAQKDGTANNTSRITLMEVAG